MGTGVINIVFEQPARTARIEPRFGYYNNYSTRDNNILYLFRSSTFITLQGSRRRHFTSRFPFAFTPLSRFIAAAARHADIVMKCSDWFFFFFQGIHGPTEDDYNNNRKNKQNNIKTSRAYYYRIRNNVIRLNV